MDISPGSTPTEENAVRTFSQMLPAQASTSTASTSVISQMAAAAANDSTSPNILAALPHLIAQMSGGDTAAATNGSRANPQLNSGNY